MSFDSLPVRFTSQITPRMSFPISKTFDVSWILVFVYAVFKVHQDESASENESVWQARLPEHFCLEMHWHAMP